MEEDNLFVIAPGKATLHAATADQQKGLLH